MMKSTKSGFSESGFADSKIEQILFRAMAFGRKLKMFEIFTL